jgi:hypothetical protein
VQQAFQRKSSLWTCALCASQINRGTFNYSRSVNNVNVTNIHNVHNKSVTNTTQRSTRSTITAVGMEFLPVLPSQPGGVVRSGSRQAGHHARPAKIMQPLGPKQTEQLHTPQTKSPSTLFVLSRIDQLQNSRSLITLNRCYFAAEKGVEHDWNHLDCDFDFGTCRSATDLAA